MHKRGLSPVIATALLIMIAIILAALLFFWARGLLTEQNQKFGEVIQNACTDVQFKTEAFVNTAGEGELSVLNRGNVPLYALDVRSENAAEGSVSFVKTFQDMKDGKEITIPQGSTTSIDIAVEQGIRAGDTLVIQPVLLGSKGGQSEVYICTDKALRITVGSA